MKPRKLSASSLDKYEKCQWAYYLTYDLGIRSPSGKGAVLGTTFHAATELAVQNKLSGKEYEPPHTFIKEALKDLKPEELALVDKESRTDVINWLAAHQYKFLEYLDGDYEIVGSEIEFNLIYQKIGEEFYQINDVLGPEYIGWLSPHDYFGVKGFIDLVLKDSDGNITIVDFKTTKKKYCKSSEQLTQENQPKIYYVAASELWPTAKDILLVFDYVHAGPSPVSFHLEHKPLILKELYQKHLEIINNKNPQRFKYENFVCKWLCGLGYSNGPCAENWSKLQQGLIQV